VVRDGIDLRILEDRLVELGGLFGLGVEPEERCDLLHGRTLSRALPLQQPRPMYRVPRATYRVQLNSSFTFADAKSIVAYLSELGVSDLYTSPILKARKGSTHGYDIVDPSALNPELGSEDDFTALHEELQRHEIGLLLDIVPNHMAASHENAWWVSVLENGRK